MKPSTTLLNLSGILNSPWKNRANTIDWRWSNCFPSEHKVGSSLDVSGKTLICYAQHPSPPPERSSTH